MTDKETARLLQVLVMAYPSSKIQADRLTINVWHQMLQDLPYDMVMTAAQRMISTLKFPPSIADIRGAVADAVAEASGEISAGEAWARVMRALSRYGYYQPEKAREWLGERIWDTVQMIGGWAYLSTTEDEVTTLSAQFERRYKAAVEQRKNMVQIPQSVRDAMSGLVDQMTLPGFGRQALPGTFDEPKGAVPMSIDSKPPRDLRMMADEFEQRRIQAEAGGRMDVAEVNQRMRDIFRERAEAREQAEQSAAAAGT